MAYIMKEGKNMNGGLSKKKKRDIGLWRNPPPPPPPIWDLIHQNVYFFFGTSLIDHYNLISPDSVI